MKEPMEVPLFLNMGELVFAPTPCTVKTILGSCVAVCLFEPRRRWGGVCHFLLAQDPLLPQGAVSSSVRFGNVAIPFLIRKFLHRGVKPGELRAVVAGGAVLFDANEIFFVGEDNTALALGLLDRWRIPIVHQDTGGERGRRLTFQTADGRYRIEPLKSNGKLTII